MAWPISYKIKNYIVQLDQLFFALQRADMCVTDTVPCLHGVVIHPAGSGGPPVEVAKMELHSSKHCRLSQCETSTLQSFISLCPSV